MIEEKTAVPNLDAVITSLIRQRRREKNPDAKIGLQVLIDQLKTKQAGDGGPNLDFFIKQQLRLIGLH